jgi:CheY-like chemotaxis protein
VGWAIHLKVADEDGNRIEASGRRTRLLPGLLRYPLPGSGAGARRPGQQQHAYRSRLASCARDVTSSFRNAFRRVILDRALADEQLRRDLAGWDPQLEPVEGEPRTVALAVARALRWVDNRGVPTPRVTIDEASRSRPAIRVVVADDDVLLREGLASLLDRSGFEVVGQAGDGVELLALVRASRPDVTIVDIRMPPTNSTEGLDAARQIREESPEVAIVVLSAHVEVDEAMEFLAGGDRLGYLLKSRVTDIAEFLDTVE